MVLKGDLDRQILPIFATATLSRLPPPANPAERAKTDPTGGPARPRRSGRPRASELAACPPVVERAFLPTQLVKAARRVARTGWARTSPWPGQCRSMLTMRTSVS